VVGKGEVCEIKLEDPQSGALFAACPVTLPGPDQAPSVEPVMDSSRYFVLRIEDGSGAFLSARADLCFVFFFFPPPEALRRALPATTPAKHHPRGLAARRKTRVYRHGLYRSKSRV
jgi:hypothetical protein